MRQYNNSDITAIQSIWNEVILEGECFLWEQPFSKDEMDKILEVQEVIYCAIDEKDEKVVGFYVLHDNFPTRGNHIANALYAVDKSYKGQGIGKLLGSHSIKIALEKGYSAIQFNAVVSTNNTAIKLWEGLGFKKIGTIEQGFRNKNNEFVDLYIYHRLLK